MSGIFLLAPGAVAAAKKSKPSPQPVPELLLEGGRKLSFERSFTNEADVRTKKGFWTRVIDVVAGEPDYHGLIRPYSVVTDSRNRIIITRPGSIGSPRFQL